MICSLYHPSPKYGKRKILSKLACLINNWVFQDVIFIYVLVNINKRTILFPIKKKIDIAN
jgi:hypothetical protein